MVIATIFAVPFLATGLAFAAPSTSLSKRENCYYYWAEDLSAVETITHGTDDFGKAAYCYNFVDVTVAWHFSTGQDPTTVTSDFVWQCGSHDQKRMLCCDDCGMDFCPH